MNNIYIILHTETPVLIMKRQKKRNKKQMKQKKLWSRINVLLLLSSIVFGD
jgi:hypothetical protein